MFASPDANPIAALGLERSNLFLYEGTWHRGAYLPAYMWRYPFGFLPGDEDLTVYWSGEDSEPTAFAQTAAGFCDAFQREAGATIAFAKALREKELLIDRRADATLPNGRTLGLDGFQVVDTEKFARLDAGTIVDWHYKGWLALVHFHLASLERFSVLLARQSERTVPDTVAAAA